MYFYLKWYFSPSYSNLSQLTQHYMNSFSFSRIVRKFHLLYVNIPLPLFHICALHSYILKFFHTCTFEHSQLFLIKIICMIVCKYLNNPNNKIYYKMLASDTFCNIFARDREYQKQTFSLNYKIKETCFVHFLNNIRCNFLVFFKKNSVISVLFFTIIVITIMITRSTNLSFYCRIIFFSSSIFFFPFRTFCLFFKN